MSTNVNNVEVAGKLNIILSDMLRREPSSVHLKRETSLTNLNMAFKKESTCPSTLCSSMPVAVQPPKPLSQSSFNSSALLKRGTISAEMGVQLKRAASSMEIGRGTAENLKRGIPPVENIEVPKHGIPSVENIEVPKRGNIEGAKRGPVEGTISKRASIYMQTTDASKWGIDKLNENGDAPKRTENTNATKLGINPAETGAVKKDSSLTDTGGLKVGAATCGDVKKDLSLSEGDVVNKERYHIVQEIVRTEKQYVRDLQIILKLFLKPLQVYDVLSKNEVGGIFMNWESLCELHEQILLQMEEVVAEDDANLGTVFISLVNFLKIYTSYCNGYNKSLEILTKCEKDNSIFSIFLKTTEQKSECNGLKLRDFLIKPIQRLCKYPLLFKELLSVTPTTSSDYPLVLQTCEKLNSVAQSVNENAAEILNFQKLLLFNKSVTGYEVDVGSYWYVRDEILIDSTTGRNRHVYLMTQEIIITKIPNSKIIKGKREKFLVALDIENIDLQTTNLETELVLAVTTSEGKQIYKFTTPNAASRSSWFADLTETIEQANQGYKVPKNVFHVVDTSKNTATFRKTGRRKETIGNGNRKKLSKIFKIEENEMANNRIMETGDSSENSATESLPSLPIINNIKIEKGDVSINRRLVSTRSVPLIPTFPNAQDITPAPPPVTPKAKKSEPSEAERLQEQIQTLEKEKKEWQLREKTLLLKIQSLERIIGDKENIRHSLSQEDKAKEELFLQYKDLSVDLQKFLNKFDLFESKLSATVDGNTVHNPNNKRNRKNKM